MYELEERLKDCHAAVTEKQELISHFEKEMESMKNSGNASANM